VTHANDEAYYKKIWYWSTPQADCADGDAGTTCKDQDAWVAAWTALRGA
jgi:putative spermidine/putrescine transport system substrate-binding protein